LNLVLPDSAPVGFVGTGTLASNQRAFALSPDGKTLVYATPASSGDLLYRRDLDDFKATPIAGTEGAFDPFFSPDGRWVGFFVSGEMRKVPLEGGAVVPLAAVPEAAGAVWSREGRILVGAREGALLGWVPEGGGAIEEVPNPLGLSRLPRDILPDGSHALSEVWTGGISNVLGIVELETGRTMALTDSGPIAADSMDRSQGILAGHPRLLDPGHLVYSTRVGITVVAFDATTLRFEGQPVEALTGVRVDGNAAQFDVSENGTLVYAVGRNSQVGPFGWKRRDAGADSLGFPAEYYGTFDLSPNGRRVATLVSTPTGRTELWVYELERQTHTKVETRGVPYLPLWWPDSRRLVFLETTPTPPYTRVAVRQLVESTGERDTLTVGWELNDIAPDTTWAVGSLGFGNGIWIIPLEDGGEPVAVNEFPTAWGGAISGDGRWIAYTSNESGKYEIYVVARERLGERKKVSLDGGEEAVWSPLGDELFYRWGRQWFAVDVPPQGGTEFGRANVIFEGPFTNVPERSHDIAPDGRSHLVILGPPGQSTGHLNVITNWANEVVQAAGG
jgi:serine/threonine-protein kinase